MEYYKPEKKNKTKTLLIIVAFAIVLIPLIYYAFVGQFEITGGIVSQNVERPISIDAEIGLTEIEIDEKNIEARLMGVKSTTLNIGTQEFEFSQEESSLLLLESFDGEITIEKGPSSQIDGSVERAIVRGIPITNREKNRIDITTQDKAEYESMTISNVTIRNLEYETSGTINIGEQKSKIEIENENIKVNEFGGEITIQGDKMRLKGKINSMSIEGENSISVA